MSPLIDRGLTIGCNDGLADSLDNSSLASICSWRTVDMFEGRLKMVTPAVLLMLQRKLLKHLGGWRDLRRNGVFTLFVFGPQTRRTRHMPVVLNEVTHNGVC